MLEIHYPSLADAEELLQFELENRDYFESWINARDASYYTLSAIRRAIEMAQGDALIDRAHQFLVKSDDMIVGRVNLTSVTRPYYNKASLGYRIGERFAGNGYATEAVKLVLERAGADLDLWRIEAAVRPENQGSARVLLSNGFVVYGTARRSMKLHGVWYDLDYFERHLTCYTSDLSPCRADPT